MRQKRREMCGETHPLLCEDPEGEIPLVCGLPKGHSGQHEDRREVESRERAPRSG